MQTLNGVLRGQLENTIKSARDIAEIAANAALEQLCIGAAKPDISMTDEQLMLRRRLRTHGRQLGDLLDPIKQTQEVFHLMEEVAYEHWHRMLFARFLAENNLLMFCDEDNLEMSVPIDLEECNELASEMNAKNGWDLAAKIASKMLPQIFRVESPVFEIEFAPEHQKALEDLVSGIQTEIFTATDSLGWVYQFWQSKRKNVINGSEIKIGANEIAAVTQLFTEQYMVHFLLDNSLGAWWMTQILCPSDFEVTTSEEELRRKGSLSDMRLDFTRFNQHENGTWKLAAGNYEKWPKKLCEFKLIDPCCGSGHFLVAAFQMLVPMRMKIECISAREAVDLVLLQNIYGLEIDQRCVELAAFSLALTAWKYPNSGGYRILPDLNIACTGLSINAKKDEWLSLANDDSNLRFSLENLYSQFIQAPSLGSLINPEKSLGQNSLFETKWESVSPLLKKALSGEKNDEMIEMGVVAKGISKAASILSDKYTLVITNVPYRSSNDLSPEINRFLKLAYREASTAIETAFLLRCLQFCREGSTTCVVLPQDWLFKTSYEEMRINLLNNDFWHLIAILGPKAFQTPMWDFNVQLLIISRGKDSIPQNHTISGIDVSQYKSPLEKSIQIISSPIQKITQKQQLKNPDSRIILQTLSKGISLNNYAKSVQGIKTGDDGKVRRCFWELHFPNKEWNYYQSTFSKTAFYGGLEYVIFWGDDGTGLARRQGNQAWSKKGVAVSQMSVLPCAIYLGEKFDSNMTAIVPLKRDYYMPLLAYSLSEKLSLEVRKIDSSLKPTNGSFEKIPFDISYWEGVAQKKYPNGLPKPFSNDPTQWIFHGHPCKNVEWNDDVKWTDFGNLRKDSTVLQIAVARLLGYQWPSELDDKMELSDESREIIAHCKNLSTYSDKDGIVCIPAIRGERSAADRLIDLLAASYESKWTASTLSELLAASGWIEKSLETWLRDSFFTQHCKLFHNRPFIWHLWDGQPDGFSVLINYYKFDRNTLQILIYSYLEDWIKMQKEQADNETDGAEDRLSAAKGLKERLISILEGESPLDVFVRWKSIDQQSIGWDPDFNDGVRLNIRPWITVNDIKKKGSGVLRDKPNIKWDKDRGKDNESAPWYLIFDGDRINDYHLTLKEKQDADN